MWGAIENIAEAAFVIVVGILVVFSLIVWYLRHVWQRIDEAMTVPEHEKPVLFKYTEGVVRQDFVGDKCVGQKFMAAEVVWTDEAGESISVPPHQYQTFDMLPPGFVDQLDEAVNGLAQSLCELARQSPLVNEHAWPDFQSLLGKLIENLKQEVEDVR